MDSTYNVVESVDSGVAAIQKSYRIVCAAFINVVLENKGEYLTVFHLNG